VVTANAGFEPMENAYFNITAEIHNHGHSFRGAEDARATSPINLATYPDSNMTQAPGYPYTNLIEGMRKLTPSWLRTMRDSTSAEASNFTHSVPMAPKRAASLQNYRQPNIVATPTRRREIPPTHFRLASLLRNPIMRPTTPARSASGASWPNGIGI